MRLRSALSAAKESLLLCLCVLYGLAFEALVMSSSLRSAIIGGQFQHKKAPDYSQFGEEDNPDSGL